MEITSSTLCFFTLVLLFLASILVLQKLLNKSEKHFQLPPGPKQLPIIGNLHHLAAKNMPPHRRLEELARVYGPVMYLRLGEVPTVVVSSAEGAKEVLKIHDKDLANRPKLIVAKIVYYNFSDLAFAPYGEYWRQLRKIATLELFTPKQVQSFELVREEEVNKLIGYLGSEAASGSAVNLSEKLFSLIFSITSRIVLNTKGEGEVEVEDSFRVLFTSLLDVLSGFYAADLYPSIKWLASVSGLKRKLENMVKESDRLLDPIIEEHKLKKREGKTEEGLLDILLRFEKDDNGDFADPDLSFSLTVDNIKAVVLEIFTAGHETTVSIIEWAMSELLRNPNVMKRAQAEIREVLYQRKGKIDESGLKELKFLKLVIKETMRLHFIAPLLTPRETIKPCQIQGYDIPPKTRILVNAFAIARDPKYWTNPNLFEPERFENSSIDYKGTNFEFIPFGAGRRMCPGVGLGMVHVELVLAMLLYHFDWKLPGELKPEDLDMDEVCGLSVRRKNPLHIIPVVVLAYASPSAMP